VSHIMAETLQLELDWDLVWVPTDALSCVSFNMQTAKCEIPVK
jgi:hypothetical protein